jgi:hypothetical protein
MKRTHPGRPPLDDDDPSAHVTLTIPSKQLDAFCRRALREDVSVPEIIRRDLKEKASRIKPLK